MPQSYLESQIPVVIYGYEVHPGKNLKRKANPDYSRDSLVVTRTPVPKSVPKVDPEIPDTSADLSKTLQHQRNTTKLEKHRSQW